MEDKITVRKSMLARRRALSEEFVRAAAAAAADCLFSLPLYRNADCIMLYMDYRREMPTGIIFDRVLSDGKKLALPHTSADFLITPYLVEDRSQLKTSALGIIDPDPSLCRRAEPEWIDLVIVPGVAFDLHGGRIGFGRGCYDRFLPCLRPGVPKLALAYDFQIEDRVPSEATDIPMDYLLTESGLRALSAKL